jgi:hypothetical protein
MLIAVMILLPLAACAEDISGRYESMQEGSQIVLNIEELDGQLSGTLYTEGMEYEIQGFHEDGEVNGLMSAWGEGFPFTGSINGDHFRLAIQEIDPEYGSESYEVIDFTRSESGSNTQPTPEALTEDLVQGEIVINGKTLSADDVAHLVQTYNVTPLPGNYWYDSSSGLYGVIGFQAFGFMLPGHSFGALDPGASGGNTGVFVNGRHLPQVEWVIWSQMLGYVIQPGRYWLDASGNAGYEGNPMPTDNLYLAAQRNTYAASGGGAGGGGDNTWSTRFSAGNYDSGGARGYVSVPGHGPIGYGF